MPQLYSQFAVAIQEEARGIFGVIGVVGREDRFTVRRGFRKRERYMTSESSSSSPSSAPGLAFFITARLPAWAIDKPKVHRSPYRSTVR
jgi:hypothetical protein